jgi:Tfp pilus tip-associated adhesin PilY1
MRTTDYAELGYMVGQMTPTPVIGQWQDQPVVVFGNGVDSETGATLFVVDAETGTLVDKLSVSSDTDNGLAGARLVLDGNGDIAAAYAGDLNGNLWKFDFTGKRDRTCHQWRPPLRCGIRAGAGRLDSATNHSACEPWQTSRWR